MPINIAINHHIINNCMSNKQSITDSEYTTIRVYSNTQNRMALGILHAYLRMFPQTTLKDLCKAFPEKLNPDSGVKQLFIPIEKMVDEPKWQDYFREDEELLLVPTVRFAADNATVTSE